MPGIASIPALVTFIRERAAHARFESRVGSRHKKGEGEWICNDLVWRVIGVSFLKKNTRLTRLETVANSDLYARDILKIRVMMEKGEGGGKRGVRNSV